MQLSKPTTFILGLLSGVIVVVLVGATAMQQGYLKADLLSGVPTRTEAVEISQNSSPDCGYHTFGIPNNWQCTGGCEEGRTCEVRLTNNPNNPTEHTCACWTLPKSCETTADCLEATDSEELQCLQNSCFGGTCDLISTCDEGEVCDARGRCIEEEGSSVSSEEFPRS